MLHITVVVKTDYPTFLLGKWAFPCLSFLENSSKAVLLPYIERSKWGTGALQEGPSLAISGRNHRFYPFSQSFYLKVGQPTSQIISPLSQEVSRDLPL